MNKRDNLAKGIQFVSRPSDVSKGTVKKGGKQAQQSINNMLKGKSK